MQQQPMTNAQQAFMLNLAAQMARQGMFAPQPISDQQMQQIMEQRRQELLREQAIQAAQQQMWQQPTLQQPLTQGVPTGGAAPVNYAALYNQPINNPNLQWNGLTPAQLENRAAMGQIQGDPEAVRDAAMNIVQQQQAPNRLQQGINAQRSSL